MLRTTKAIVVVALVITAFAISTAVSASLHSTATTPNCPSQYSSEVSGTHVFCIAPFSEDPSQNGHANQGGGRNGDEGPGPYAPNPISPPATPYVPPAPPTSDDLSEPGVMDA